MNVLGCFDPVSINAIKQIKALKKYPLTIVVKQQGIVPIHVRISWLKKILRSYSKIHIEQEKNQNIDLQLQEHVDFSRGLIDVERSIRQDILKNGYYFVQIVNENAYPSRAEHIFSVAKMCVELAKHHHLDVHKAYLAGMLHDITKGQRLEKQKQLLMAFDPDKLELPEPVWHSFSAVYWIKQNLYYYDRSVLNAIYRHTMGDCKTPLDKIVYIADKIEPTRKYDTTYQTKLAYQDIDKAFDYIYQQSQEYIQRKENE